MRKYCDQADQSRATQAQELARAPAWRVAARKRLDELEQAIQQAHAVWRERADN